MLKLVKVILAFGVVLLCGCSNYSIDDAYSKAASNKFATDSTEVVTKEPLSVNEKETKVDVVWDVDRDSDKQNILKYGESCQYSDLSLTVENAMITTNVKDVKGLEREELGIAFTNYIINIWDEKNVKFDEEGKVSKDGYTCLFIKVKMKNESSKSIKICVDPALYNMDNSNNFSYIMSAESYAFDKNTNLKEANKNSLVYTFMPDEEIETVLFYYIQNPQNIFKDVYMSAAFLSGINSPTAIPQGNYMLPLNIVNGNVE